MQLNNMIHPNVAKEIQEENLRALVRNGGFEFTPTFKTYTSGQIGPYYVQSGVVQNSGRTYDDAVRDVAFTLEQTIGRNSEDLVFSGGESRDWIFSMPVSAIRRIPHVMLYKDGKTVGADMSRRKVVHIADLNNEGSSPRDLWVPAIKKAGGEIKDIIFYVDRLEDGVGVMAELGLRSQAIVPLDEHAWDCLLEWETVTPEIYRNLRERQGSKEARRAWAEKMLRSQAGIETLAELFHNPKTIAKGRKILDKGYPYMREELTERLLRVAAEKLK